MFSSITKYGKIASELPLEQAHIGREVVLVLDAENLFRFLRFEEWQSLSHNARLKLFSKWFHDCQMTLGLVRRKDYYKPSRRTRCAYRPAVKAYLLLDTARAIARHEYRLDIDRAFAANHYLKERSEDAQRDVEAFDRLMESYSHNRFSKNRLEGLSRLYGSKAPSLRALEIAVAISVSVEDAKRNIAFLSHIPDVFSEGKKQSWHDSKNVNKDISELEINGAGLWCLRARVQSGLWNARHF